MADAKISDLNALVTQASTDLYETSANGTGSFKETRAQQTTYIKGAVGAKSGVKAVYTTNLVAVYDNGVAGVGATLTMSDPGAIPLANGNVTLNVGDPVLMIGQNSQLQNGIYVVTDAGDFDNSGIFTRSNDYDTATKIVIGSYTAVALGDENYRASIFIQTTENVTVGTSPIVFEKYQPQPITSSNAVRGCISIYTDNLDATYDNGPNFDGVGATLTANSVGLLPDASGVMLTTGDRVVVNGQSAKLQNGIYDVQDIGGVSNLYILSRARDYDEYFNITVASYAPVAQGTHAGTLYVQKNKNITVGTSDIEFIDRADFGSFDSVNMIYVDPNGDNSNTGRSEDSPMANPFDAIVKYVGTLANPQCVAVNTAVYVMPDTFIRPNCSVECAAGTKLDVSFFISLDTPIWSAAAAGSGSYFIGGTWEGTWDCDFGAAGPNKYLWFQDVNKVGTATFSNGVLIFYRNVIVNGFTLNSATAYLRSSTFQGNVVVAPSLAGGASTFEMENCVIDPSFNISLSGASGSVTTAKITGTPMQGSLTITGTFVNLKIDAASIPAGGITYAGGATSAQVTLIGGVTAAMIDIKMNAADKLFASSNGSNTTGDGTEHNAYADPFFASNSATGTQSAPKMIVGTIGNYSTATFAIKPNVWLSGELNALRNATAGYVWGVVGNVTLDSSWSTAAANSTFYMQNIRWSDTTNFFLNFATATNGVYFVAKNCACYGFQFQGAASHIPNITLDECEDVNSGVQSLLVNAVIRNSKFSSVTHQCLASGGATTLNIENSTVTGAVLLQGSTGGATLTATISNTKIGTLTLSGTNVTLSIDADSVPQGGVTYSSGATSAQVTFTSPASAVYASSTRTNYIPTSATVEGNFQGLDNALQQNIDIANTVIGGHFDYNPWQRGVSFPGLGPALTYTADRFYYESVGSGVVHILKTADAPTVAQAGVFSVNCFHVDVTTADASIAATDLYSVNYIVTGVEFTQIAQRPFTVSFWIKATKTGIYSLGFRNAGEDRCYCAEYTVSASNTWEEIVVTIPASPSAGTWSYTQGTVGLCLTFYLAAGSNFFVTPGSWQSAAGAASANQVNAMDSTSNDFKLQFIKVEAGSVATPFPTENPEEVRAECQRFYQKSYNIGVYPGAATMAGMISFVAAPTTGALGKDTRFKVDMIGTPIVVAYDGTGTPGKVYRGADGADATIDFEGSSGVRIYSASGISSGTFQCHYTARSELFL